jgi:mannose-6-phosphate isomerase-like protein (cupin superfamily)
MTIRNDSRNLASTCLRLRPDASIEQLNVDDGFWERLVNGRLGDFHHEYLVTLHDFDSDWTSWEVHPNGDEIVCLLDGAATLILEYDDGERTVDLTGNGTFVLVPRGTWHTARVAKSARMLFITAGEGTEHRAIAQ